MSSAVKTIAGACLTAAALLVATIGAPADSKPRFTRTEVEVSVPDVTLINQNGDRVRFQDIVNSDEPVCVDFIFATCTTICPILSAGYSSVQRKLGDDRGSVRLISISIDPEHDGPEEMRAYLDRYRAASGWDFLTGTRTDIDEVMRAFGAFIPDKMSHRPLVYVRSPETGGWVQIHGFASSADLMDELRRAAGESEREESEHEERESEG